MRGCTITFTDIDEPVQVLFDGVMVYLTSPSPVKVWAIEEPVDALAPETVPLTVETVQLYDVPPVVELNEMLGALPLHTVVEYISALATSFIG